MSNRYSSESVLDAHNDTSGNSWFENPDWSDLTIELSDGRRIPVHKTVLCTRNAYFNAMCGLNSRFAVCQLDIIIKVSLLKDTTGERAKGDQDGG